MAVVEIVAAKRTVEDVVLLCLVVEKSIEGQYSTNGSCRVAAYELCLLVVAVW